MPPSLESPIGWWAGGGCQTAVRRRRQRRVVCSGEGGDAYSLFKTEVCLKQVCRLSWYGRRHICNDLYQDWQRKECGGPLIAYHEHNLMRWHARS